MTWGLEVWGWGPGLKESCHGCWVLAPARNRSVDFEPSLLSSEQGLLKQSFLGGWAPEPDGGIKP